MLDELLPKRKAHAGEAPRDPSPPRGPEGAGVDLPATDVDLEAELFPEPEGGEGARLGVIQQFCDGVCPKRETCPLRATHINLARAHQTIEASFAAQDNEVATLAQAGLLPLVQVFEEERIQCAIEAHAEHERQEAERAQTEAAAQADVDRVLPAVRRVLHETLGADAEDLRERLGDIPEIKRMLHELLHRSAPAKHDVAPAREVPVLARSPVADEEAHRLLVEYRERYPEDDALAARRLLNETGVSLNQAAKLSMQAIGVHWGKSTLSAWMNNPGTQAKTSLNRDRIEQLPRAES